MTREIKFRAWDKDTRQMIDNIITYLGAYDQYDDKTKMWSIGSMMEKGDNSRFEFMQYTGLKDVNGIDIYESDIVRTRGGIAGVVEFGSVFIDEDNYPLCWFIQCKTPVTLDGDSSDWLMVIGDIHSNPELLEELK